MSERIGELTGVTFQMEEALFGGAAYDETGEPLPEATLAWSTPM